MSKRIIILHKKETGEPSHYIALEELVKHNGYDKIVFHELSLLTQFKFILTKGYSIRRFLGNILFLFFLPFIKPSKIVLGLAPFDKNLPILMFLMRKHEVYYHTSFTRWNGIDMVHPTKSEGLKKCWRSFTNNYVKHIFAVSEKTKSELISNGYSSEEKISVVNHSYKDPINCITHKAKENTFLQVSSLNKNKGVEELLDYFSKHPDLRLTLVGRGKLQPLVEEYSSKYPNIIYKGFIKGVKNIYPIYQDNCFLLLNSQRNSTWEELFGMVIIEGMACGCVPITTDHPGPKEIITPEVNGYICKENEIRLGIEWAKSLSDDSFQKIRLAAIGTGKNYHCSKISEKWKKVL